mmetsp:Transcript_12804/g.14694  ORF Transcript_12804/g.14694 Transcript_12804/m.14694 type:complete len:92 (+) Transcript_12804:1156-1431(+)
MTGKKPVRCVRLCALGTGVCSFESEVCMCAHQERKGGKPCVHLVGKPWFGGFSSVAQERNLTEVGRAPPSAPQPFVMIDHGGAKPSQSLKS